MKKKTLCVPTVKLFKIGHKRSRKEKNIAANRNFILLMITLVKYNIINLYLY